MAKLGSERVMEKDEEFLIEMDEEVLIKKQKGVAIGVMVLGLILVILNEFFLFDEYGAGVLIMIWGIALFRCKTVWYEP